MPGSLLVWLVPPLAAFLTAYFGVGLARPWLLRAGVIDRPTPRSSHGTPTPRGGGLGILAGFLAGLGASAGLHAMGAIAPLLAVDFSALLTLLLCGSAVGVVGLVDDVRPQRPGLRLGGQVLIAALFALSAGVLEALRLPFVGEVRLGWLAGPATVLWLVAVTNIYNFMDGIDGLAAGQAGIAGLFLALAGAHTGYGTVALTSAVLAAAALGFLAHNFPPARIFMGDVGSTFVGFTFAALAVLGAQAGPARISIYVSALLLAPFLFDATLTLARRVWRRERWYQAHRSHLYQRLVKAGYSHRRVSLMYYLLAFVLGGLGLAEVATGQGATEAFLLVGLVPLVVLALWVRRVEAAAQATVAGAES